MPYNLQGDWDILDPINDNWSPAPSSLSVLPALDGHIAPESIFTKTLASDAATVTERTTWIPSRRELRLFVVQGCLEITGRIIGRTDLEGALKQARVSHGRVDFISLVIGQGDYGARCSQSANLRSFLARNKFTRVHGYASEGLLFEKDLTPQKPRPAPHSPVEPPQRSLAEQVKVYRDAGLNIPPYLQFDLQHAQRMANDAKNDPHRFRAELEQRIAELEALAQRDANTVTNRCASGQVSLNSKRSRDPNPTGHCGEGR